MEAWVGRKSGKLLTEIALLGIHPATGEGGKRPSRGIEVRRSFTEKADSGTDWF